MNKREHFERWIKCVKPNMPPDYNEQEGYYYHDIVSMMWQAWQASPKTRPTEPRQITKEQLVELMKPNPETIVDRLRGIYPGIKDAYPVTPLQREAAGEIERLRDGLGNDVIESLRNAVKETEYKYFGHYELSDNQWDAVITLIDLAKLMIQKTAPKGG